MEESSQPQPQSQARQLAGYSFLVVFASDDTIDEGELAMLERIALKDNIVDEEEKRVLHNIFARVSKETVTDKVWEEIQRFKAEQGIE